MGTRRTLGLLPLCEELRRRLLMRMIETRCPLAIDGDVLDRLVPLLPGSGGAVDALDFGQQLSRISLRERMLKDGQTVVYADERVLYLDDDHPSLSGARYLLPLFEPYLER